MTLNLTVVSSRYIYQSADLRLVDVATGEITDFETQKIVPVTRAGWGATVCFSGVGRTRDLDVGEWLDERIASIDFKGSFQQLLDELEKANDWLSGVSAPHNRHSFSIGAFVGSKPVFVIVSNFESTSALPSETASSRLKVSKMRPTKPKTFVSGQKQEVKRPDRRRLAALVGQDPEPQKVYDALAALNRSVATRNDKVSPACMTAYVRCTGEGGAYAHGIGDRPFIPFMGLPGMRDAVVRLAKRQFGPNRGRV